MRTSHNPLISDMVQRLQRELANFRLEDRSGLEQLASIPAASPLSGLYPQHFDVQVTLHEGRYKLSLSPSAQAKTDGMENEAFQRVTAFVSFVAEKNGAGFGQTLLHFPTNFLKRDLPRLPVVALMSGLSDERAVETRDFGDLVLALNLVMANDNQIPFPSSVMER